MIDFPYIAKAEQFGAFYVFGADKQSIFVTEFHNGSVFNYNHCFCEEESFLYIMSNKQNGYGQRIGYIQNKVSKFFSYGLIKGAEWLIQKHKVGFYY